MIPRQSTSICSTKRPTPKKNTVKTCEFVLNRFNAQFGKRDLASVSQEEVLEFLLSMTRNNKQATKRNRYSVLASFYNFSINTGLPGLTNPCNTAVVREIFKRPQAIQWNIVDKETVDDDHLADHEYPKRAYAGTYGPGRNDLRLRQVSLQIGRNPYWPWVCSGRQFWSCYYGFWPCSDM